MSVPPIKSISISNNEAQPTDEKSYSLEGHKVSSGGVVGREENEEKIIILTSKISFNSQESEKSFELVDSFGPTSEQVEPNQIESNQIEPDNIDEDDDLIGAFESEIVEENKGEVLENKGEVLENKGEVLENKSEVLENKGEALENKGEALENKGEVLENKGEVLENKSEVLENKSEVLESYSVQSKIETQTEAQSRIKQFRNFLDMHTQKNNLVYVEGFKEEIENFDKTLVTTPKERFGAVIVEFLEQKIDEGKIGRRGPNGEFIPLTAKEKEEVKKEFRAAIQDFLNDLFPQTQVKPTENKEVKDTKKKPENFIVIVYKPDQQQFSSKTPVKVLIKLDALIREILIAEIIKKSIEEAGKEKKDIQERILQVAIKAEIIKSEELKRDILKSEINLQNLKFKINKSTINIPVYVITKTIKNSNKAKSEKRFYLAHSFKFLKASALS